VKWFVGIGLVLVAAMILQAGLIAFAMYVLLGVMLVSRYLAREWVTNLDAVRDPIPENCEVGDELEMKVRVRNEGKLPVAWVLAEDLLPERALKSRPPRIRVSGKRLRIAMIRSKKSLTVKYKLKFDTRGYYQIGPLVLETGDLFGLHRRHRIVTEPKFLMVYPKVVPLPKYNFASERPIGEVHLAHRLYEDPTRTAGVRPYHIGDPLQRIHWRATARTGQLHSRIYEPTTLAGATVLLDFHSEGYHARGEPFRSELAVTVAVSIAYAVCVLNQQIGFACNGRDASDRITIVTRKLNQREGDGYETREEMRDSVAMREESDRLRPVMVQTRRGFEQFQQIREALARVELTDGFSFAQLMLEMAPRIPRDATVIAVLPAVPMETSLVLGTLRRQGFAVTAILIGLEDEERARAHGRLAAEGVRDVRYVNSEADLALLGEQKGGIDAPNPYQMEVNLA